MHEIISVFSKNIEMFENQVVKIISLWANDDSIIKKFSVSYPTDFNIYSLAESLDNATKLINLNLGQELNRIYARKILIPKLMSLTEEEEDKLFSDL